MMATPIVRYLVLTVVVLIGAVDAYCPGFFVNQTACSCFAYVDGAVIKCSGPEGPGVVEQLKSVQTEIRELSLENANIVEIGARAFRNLRIKKLILDNNRIKLISSDAFRGLESTLQELSLAHNKLTEVPTDALIGMRALTTLSLKCNNIGDIYGSVFRNVSQLIELNLACNQICKIQGAAFYEIRNTLQSLVLDNNCLQAIPADAIRSLDALIALHAQYNQIDAIGPMQLANMTNLQMRKIAGNKIRSIDRHAFGASGNASQLRYIYLNENQLNSIAPGTFQQFSRLEILDLAYNNLGELAAGAFADMPHLMQLNLEGNAIKDIAPGAFASTPLLLLMIGHNCLSSVSQQMFVGVPFLRQLALTANNIRLVQPLAFSHLANLHLLDLTRNKMQVIQPGALTSSSHVTVMLQENPLVCSQDGYHIVQGGQAIHLLNEPNHICQTDYTRDVQDQCPTRPKQPAPPMCCGKSTTTTTTATTTTTTTTKSPAISAADKPKPTVVTPTIVTHNGVYRPQQVRNMTRSRAVNMERFWRLSRRPGAKSNRNNTIDDTMSVIPLMQPSPVDTAVIDEVVPVDQQQQQSKPLVPENVGTVPAIAQVPRVPNDQFHDSRGPFLPDSGLMTAGSDGIVDATKVSIGGGDESVISRQSSGSLPDGGAQHTHFLAQGQKVPPRVRARQQNTNAFQTFAEQFRLSSQLTTDPAPTTQKTATTRDGSQMGESDEEFEQQFGPMVHEEEENSRPLSPVDRDRLDDNREPQTTSEPITESTPSDQKHHLLSNQFRSQLPPWIVTSSEGKEKQTVEFSSDTHAVESRPVDQPIPEASMPEDK